MLLLLNILQENRRAYKEEKNNMFLKIIIPIVLLLIFLSFYKLISWQLKKQLNEAEKIIKECKTEEERQKSLAMLKKKNIKRSLASYLLFMVCLSIILFFVLLIIAKSHAPKHVLRAGYDKACETLIS